MRLSEEYDVKSLKKYLLWFLGMLVVVKATAGFGMIILPVLLMVTLSKNKPVETLFWVLFMTASSTGNRQIFGNTTVAVIIIRMTLVLLCVMVAGKAFGKRESRVTAPFWGIFIYVFWECISSAQGFSPIVSYLKLFLFFIVFMAMIGVANCVNVSTRVNAKILRSAFLSMVIVMIVGSVVIMPIGSLSYMAADEEMLKSMLAGESVSLFCGMTAHSQVMGPMAGVLGTIIFADLVFSIKKWDPIYVLILTCCPILVYKSSSRTGMGTFLAGICFVTFVMMQARGMGAKWKGKIMMVLTAMAFGGILLVAAIPGSMNKISQFALKWSSSATTKDVSMKSMFSSRQEKIDIAKENFKRKPIFGNGFQVSQEMENEKRSGLASYLTAPIEKGVWVYAILEEGGAVGLGIFVSWAVWLICVLVKRGGYIAASAFFTFIMANTGEFCIFAMTYLGGLYWTIVLAASTLDVQRLKGQKGEQVFFVPIEQVIQEEGLDAWTRRLG